MTLGKFVGLSKEGYDTFEIDPLTNVEDYDWELAQSELRWLENLGKFGRVSFASLVRFICDGKNWQVVVKYESEECV